MAIDPATLRLRYPAFADVPDETINYWLDDAARIVTPAWGADQEPGTLALAAHNMSLNGVLAVASGSSSSIPAGVTSFKSASVSLTFSDAAAAQAAEGGYGSTSYGREFQVMLRRNAGGAFLVGYVEAPAGWCDVY
jgi:hypothetical protein